METPAPFPCKNYWWYLPLSFAVAGAILAVNIAAIPSRELDARFFFNSGVAFFKSLLAFWLISLLYLPLLYLVWQYASRRRSYWLAAALYWLLTGWITYWICVASPWELIRYYDAGGVI